LNFPLFDPLNTLNPLNPQYREKFVNPSVAACIFDANGLPKVPAVNQQRHDLVKKIPERMFRVPNAHCVPFNPLSL
jgi:hypothetical protein